MELEPPLPILVRLFALDIAILLEFNADSLLFFNTARFSPDDKYSKQRVTLKRRLGLLLTQKPEDKM